MRKVLIAFCTSGIILLTPCQSIEELFPYGKIAKSTTSCDSACGANTECKTECKRCEDGCKAAHHQNAKPMKKCVKSCISIASGYGTIRRLM